MVPNGWKKFLINEICLSIVPGRNKPKTFDGNIPWVTTPEINGRYLPSVLQVNYISDEAVKEVGAKVVPAGAVIMSAVGELGVVAIAKQPLVINQQLHAFVCTDVINNEYLAYWLETQKPYMESVASKTTILYLNKANCESIPVLAPILPEQEKIAQILSTWDQAISATEKLLKNSQQQKKALMQQLLTGKKRLLDENGVRFHDEWNQVHVSEICHVGRGRVISKTEIEKNKGTFPVYSSQTLHNGVMGYLNSYDFDGEVVTWTTDGVNAGTVFYRTGKFNCTNVCGTLTPKKSSIDLKFLAFSLSREAYKYVSHTLANPKLMNGVMGTISLKFPSFKEQQKIAKIISVADKEIETLQKKLDCLKQEKKALMQQLLTGKKRVKVAA
ncbi:MULTISPECIES: restriction endonuclease subunit S [unclassified Acinetobacter]|uniref:restriction endonuclease subunit S n=1 Tax=unclassified Acinetobacter TaxID=196816 RepID=UPI0015D23172|nr:MULTISPECIES: restriction endonuclease subunit S [unclassified Acinetobacter]UUS62228.1 restriction endonuclease subunit S [Acinetobacter sp. YH16056_T]